MRVQKVLYLRDLECLDLKRILQACGNEHSNEAPNAQPGKWLPASWPTWATCKPCDTVALSPWTTLGFQAAHSQESIACDPEITKDKKRQSD